MEIKNLLELFQRLLFRIYEKRNITVSVSDVEDALYILFANEMEFLWRGSLWDIDITEEQAFERLREFDFGVLTSCIETEADILPEELRIRYKARVKARGIVWVIHTYDHDPFPSIPHAHQLESNVKLDLSTGNCYCKRKFVHKITRKELIEIREKAKMVFKGPIPELCA